MNRTALALLWILALAGPAKTAQEDRSLTGRDGPAEQLLPPPRPKPLLRPSERRRIKRIVARLKRVIQRYPGTLAARAAERIVSDYEDLLALDRPPAKPKNPRRGRREKRPP